MRFSYIDIHTHLNFAAFDPVVDFGIAPQAQGNADAKIHYGVETDRDAVIQRALDAGVAMVNVGTQKDTSRKAVEIAEKSLLPKTAVLPLGKGEYAAGGVYAIVGVHPIHTSKSFHDVKELGEIPPAAPTTPPRGLGTPPRAGEDGSAPFTHTPSCCNLVCGFTKGRIGSNGFTSRGEEFDYDYYKKLALHPKVVGIGECGLDYFRFKIEDLRFKEELRKQEEAFRKQIELAIEVKKPLMLHIRNGSDRSAYNDAFSILKSYNLNLKSGRPGNLHFFAGSIEEAKPFLDAGFSFSFTGVITFTHDYDEIIRYLPPDRIMSETDAPYVAPSPYRGKRNEPLYVKEVVKAIACIRGEDEDEVRVRILKNAEALFGLSLS